MLKLKRILVIISMIVTWATTLLIAIGSPTYTGKVCIFFSGVFINTLLGIYYSYLKQRPASFDDWLKM